MSTASKVVLGLSLVVTVGVMATVHIQEKLVRKNLRDGVIKDMERQRLKQKTHTSVEHIGFAQQPDVEKSKMLTVGASQE